MIYLGLIIASITQCAQRPAVSVYIAEIVHLSIRGNMLTLPSLFTTIGTLSIWIERLVIFSD